MVIARIEALISGAGEAEAIRRAGAYIAAGAEAIMIHSSRKTFDEIRSFMLTYNKLDKRVPVVAVPSTYSYVTEDDLFASGISVCIYANHMLRAAYPRMQQVAEGILRAGTGAYIQNMMSSVKTIINLLPNTGQAETYLCVASQVARRRLCLRLKWTPTRWRICSKTEVSSDFWRSRLRA